MKIKGCRGLLLGLLLGLSMPTLHADSWELVLRDRTRQVELNRDSVLDAGPGQRVAWVRVVLGEEESAERGFFRVQALNRFDCTEGTVTTLRRLYLDRALHTVREEVLAEPQTLRVAAGSADDQLWQAVCRPPAPRPGDLRRLAEEADRAARQAEGAR